MLLQLRIENVAVIEAATVDFSRGLNVFTGETGAGKSILIDSLGAVLGFRTSKDLVRTGAKKAFVQGVFSTGHPGVNEFLEREHLPKEDVICCSREIGADGRNVCRINGAMVTVGALRQLGALLADIHGQQETQKLADPETHMEFVDAYGGLEQDLADYRKIFLEMVRLIRMIRSLSLSEQEKEKQIQELNEEINLLESAALRAGEKQELLKARALCSQKEKTAKSLQKLLSFLEGDEETDGIPEQLQECIACADQLSGLYEICRELPDQLAEQAEFFSDLRRQLRDALDDLQMNEREPEEIEDRLELYERMEKRYGDLESALAREDQAREELDSIRLSDEQIAEKKAEYARIAPGVKKAAEEISAKRRKAGKALCREIGDELAFLNMNAIQICMAQEPCKLSVRGADKMELLLSANAGEDPKPLAKIASGGELARVMLAIKSVLGRSEPEMTQVFDEIDTGISGSAARKVGIRMAQMGRQRQVICVTHLAQIASLADAHLLIEKETENGRTYTKVHRLDEAGRERELARIISGSAPTEHALATAREMRREAETI